MVERTVIKGLFVNLIRYYEEQNSSGLWTELVMVEHTMIKGLFINLMRDSEEQNTDGKGRLLESDFSTCITERYLVYKLY